MKRMYFKTLIILVFLTYGLSSCTNNNIDEVNIDFTDSLKQLSSNEPDTVSPIYIAIASMTSPKETDIYYHDLVDYIANKIGRSIFIKEKKTYEEVNKMLENGEVSFAFICSGAYINAKRKHQAKLLVAPQIHHKTYYQSYIITRKSLNIKNFKELKGHSFAFTDPLSNTGRMYAEKQLRLLGVEDNSFFSKTVYTYAHDISIQMVNQGIIDAASVHSLIYQYIAKKYPERVKNIKIMKKSELFGIPPIVTPYNGYGKCYSKLRNVFLEINQDSTGMEILNKLGIDKFVVVQDSIYDNVRKLNE